MIKLAIFDLDGTLLDTLEDLAAAVNHALAANGLPPRRLDEVRAFVGNGIPKLAARAVPAGTDKAAEAAVLSALLSYYKDHCRDRTRPYDGIPALLQTLRAGGVKTAVVSNKANAAVQILCEAYFPGLCDFCVGAKEGVRKKPAPDAVFAALEALGVRKEDAVYVGDSEVDVQTAKNAGLPCLSVTWGFRSENILRAAGATRLIPDVPTLERLLLEKPDAER